MAQKAFINHPLLKKDVVEERLYQLGIASKCLERNTMVVLPTSLGKTVVALLVVVARFEKYGGKVLMLAPTRPLVEQHYEFFTRVMNIEPEKIVELSGQIKPEKRNDLWENATFIIATPQVIENDILTEKIEINDVTCLVFDEAHRATGNYAYTHISEKYNETAKHPHVLAITASPGSKNEKIEDVCKILNIENIIIKTEEDPDVRPYVHKKEIEWLHVRLPNDLMHIKETLSKIYDDRMKKMAESGYAPQQKYINRTDLLAFQRQILTDLKNENADSSLFATVSVLAEILKIDHAIALIETQGAKPLLSYLKKLKHEAGLYGASKASKRLATDIYFKEAIRLCEECETEHPKFSLVKELAEEQFFENPDSKIIIFTNYRDTAQAVTDSFEGTEGVRPVRFVGQSSKKEDKGLSQKEQTEILDAFRKGEYNTLVATSVAEEGLDIPSTDMVIFFEPVPSEIRSIQRKGRTGRFQTGKVIVLVTKGTRDEGYYWSSENKEKRMIHIMKSLQTEEEPEKQTTFNAYQDLSETKKETEQKKKTIKKYV